MRLIRYITPRRRGATLLLILLSGTACQGWHTARVAPESLLATRGPTTLRITTTADSQIVVDKPAIRGDTLVGTAQGKDSQEVRVPLKDIRTVATRGFSAGRTFELVLIAGVVAIGAYIGGILVSCSAASDCGN
jgi:hypothetical protein